MKLFKYLSQSDSDEERTKFRALTCKLVDKETGHKELVEKVVEQYELGNDILDLYELLNKDLRKYYKGKYKFDFTIDEGEDVDKLKIKPGRKKHIKKKAYEFVDVLAKCQRKLESYLKEQKS